MKKDEENIYLKTWNEKKNSTGNIQRSKHARTYNLIGSIKTKLFTDKTLQINEIEQTRHSSIPSKKFMVMKEQLIQQLLPNTSQRESDEGSRVKNVIPTLEFKKRIHEMEYKTQYLDSHRPTKKPSPNLLDISFNSKLKSVSQRLRGDGSLTHKKPKDLLRAIGKIDHSDWNVKEIEKKIIQNRLGKSPAHGSEKVPKWNREQFVERKKRMENRENRHPEEKYKEIDASLQNLDRKIKEGTVLEVGTRGKNKVANLAGQFIKKADVEIDKAPSTRSDPKMVLTANVKSKTPLCVNCGKAAYAVEQILIEGFIFHKACFKCHRCGTTLTTRSYCFDRNGPHGNNFFCSQHFGSSAKIPSALRNISDRHKLGAASEQEQEKKILQTLDTKGQTEEESELNTEIDGEQWVDIDFSVNLADTAILGIEITSSDDDDMDLNIQDLAKDDDSETPERIKLELSARATGAASDGGGEADAEMDEDEWRDLNFGVLESVTNEREQGNYESSSDEEYFYPVGKVDVEKNKERVKIFPPSSKNDHLMKHDGYFSPKDNDDSDDDSSTNDSSDSSNYESDDSFSYGEYSTGDESCADSEGAEEDVEEGESVGTEHSADREARELRRREVPALPRISNSASTHCISTTTDTEVGSSDESSGKNSEVQNSITEVSTDSEFAKDDPTPTRELPCIVINDESITKFMKESANLNDKYWKKRTGFNIDRKNVLNKSKADTKVSSNKNQETVVSPWNIPVVKTTENKFEFNQVLPIAQKPVARPSEYMLSRTKSTSGIATKRALELKKLYLLGNQSPLSIQKSDSASQLDSKFKSFQSNISEFQKLLIPATDISPGMQAFLASASKRTYNMPITADNQLENLNMCHNSEMAIDNSDNHSNLTGPNLLEKNSSLDCVFENMPMMACCDEHTSAKINNNNNKLVCVKNTKYMPTSKKILNISDFTNIEHVCGKKNDELNSEDTFAPDSLIETPTSTINLVLLENKQHDDIYLNKDDLCLTLNNNILYEVSPSPVNDRSMDFIEQVPCDTHVDASIVDQKYSDKIDQKEMRDNYFKIKDNEQESLSNQLTLTENLVHQNKISSVSIDPITECVKSVTVPSTEIVVNLQEEITNLDNQDQDLFKRDNETFLNKHDSTVVINKNTSDCENESFKMKENSSIITAHTNENKPLIETDIYSCFSTFSEPHLNMHRENKVKSNVSISTADYNRSKKVEEIRMEKVKQTNIVREMVLDKISPNRLERRSAKNKHIFPKPKSSESILMSTSIIDKDLRQSNLKTEIKRVSNEYNATYIMDNLVGEVNLESKKNLATKFTKNVCHGDSSALIDNRKTNLKINDDRLKTMKSSSCSNVPQTPPISYQRNYSEISRKKLQQADIAFDKINDVKTLTLDEAIDFKSNMSAKSSEKSTVFNNDLNKIKHSKFNSMSDPNLSELLRSDSKNRIKDKDRRFNIIQTVSNFFNKRLSPKSKSCTELQNRDDIITSARKKSQSEWSVREDSETSPKLTGCSQDLPSCSRILPPYSRTLHGSSNLVTETEMPPPVPPLPLCYNLPNIDVSAENKKGADGAKLMHLEGLVAQLESKRHHLAEKYQRSHTSYNTEKIAWQYQRICKDLELLKNECQKLATIEKGDFNSTG